LRAYLSTLFLLETFTNSGLLTRSYDNDCKMLPNVPLNQNKVERYALNDVSRNYLVSNAPYYYGHLIDLDFDHYPTPESILKAIHEDQVQVYEGKDPWAVHEVEPSFASQFTNAMHSLSKRPSYEMARVVDILKSSNHLVDVGGGSGVYTIAALRAYPHLKGTILELGAVAEIAVRYMEKYDVSERVTVKCCNMLSDEFPKNGDAILFANIFHDFNDTVCSYLLEKSFKSLPPGGHILISERLFDDFSGPLAVALHNLDMLCWGTGQQLTAHKLITMCQTAGFHNCTVMCTSGYFSVVCAEK